jgi:tRNA(Ile)-lysidine synthase
MIDALALVRPLLGWRRTELRAIAEASGTTFVDDPSNTDDRFERVRVRHLLAAEPWLDAAGLARAAAHAAEAQAGLDAMTHWLWEDRRRTPVGVDGQVWLDVTGLPRELRRRLARAAIRSVRVANGLLPDFDLAANIEPLLETLDADRAATQAGVMVTPQDQLWRFAQAPPRRSH